MVQWSPDTISRPDGGGYAYDDSAITGFSLTHLSGTGLPRGGRHPGPAARSGPWTPRPTDSFSHASESASAGYYRVALRQRRDRPS